MQTTATQENAEAETEVVSRLDEWADLRHALQHAAHLLPAQGPIEVFVHHNTLHAFEHLPFHEALIAGHRTYEAQTYFSEERYREMLETGRISLEDLESVVADDAGNRISEQIDGLGTLAEIRLAMLRYPFAHGPDAELRWLVAETDALERFRDEVPFLVRERLIEASQKWFSASHNGNAAEMHKGLVEKFGRHTDRFTESTWEALVLHFLWRVCRRGVEGIPARTDESHGYQRPRDLLLHATGEDTDRYVHELLIRFCSAFLDQGYADWNLPDREEGLYESFISVYRRRRGSPDRWMRSLAAELVALRKSQIAPEQSVLDSLKILGIPAAEHEEFITQSLLALGGWAGMVWQMESAAEWTVRPAPKGSLLEFLAIRLILDHQAILYVGEQSLGCNNSAREVLQLAAKKIAPRQSMSDDRRAFQVFQIAQVQGWDPERLLQLSKSDWRELVHEIESFSSMDRRRIFQEAYERHYRIAALDAIAIHAKRRHADRADASRNGRDDGAAATAGTTVEKVRPAYQVMCCIDDREESFRRHLEEADPAVETLGAAGFFAVVMYYRGAADAYYKPLCPVILTPTQYVTEDVGYTFEGVNRQRTSSRKRIGRFTHQVHTRSRTFVGGIFTGLFGSLATFPLVARVLFPRLTSQIRRNFGRLLQPPPVTQLQLERYKPEPGSENGHIGFTLEEMTGIVQRLLQDIGLTKTEDFSRLLIICGHGSASLNNPHESAYCCGACAGKRGGPNARAFAQMANDWRVRSGLAETGLRIPDDTAFVGCYHDTTSDSVVWYDLDRMPASHRPDFERAQAAIEEARLRNAHERCRRFASASLKLSNEEALRHVETRGEDLSQVRPEYNHATNAMCLVGRREWSRGLFLDRRAFLTSYDPTQDDEDHSILFRILAAAIPVCAGINLEYYFSSVDNLQFGSGSKLPHNLVSLLGIMEGANSDLRTGLYQQMVEIHEPMRLMFVIETTPEAMLSIMDRHAGIARLCRGDWVQLAVINPHTSEIMLWRNGSFETYHPSIENLPVATSSLDWYRGNRNHLGFAMIQNDNVS